MYIRTVAVRNFRILTESNLQLKQNHKQSLALLIGKNNSGKTSFIMLFDKFFRDEVHFNYNDFSTCLRKSIKGIETGSDVSHCSIQLKLEIAYSKKDNLATLSDFILDLNPKENIVRLLFECTINSDELIKDLQEIEEHHVEKFIENNLGSYVKNRFYVYANEDDLISKTRDKLVEKNIHDIRQLINYQVIHAKRNVSSSEADGSRRNVLSGLATNYFNKANVFSNATFGKINDKILEVDDNLNKTYAEYFKDYLTTVDGFVEGKLSVVSNLESRQILDNYSRVIYGDNADNFLPETLNGLGHLNILFLLLVIEVKKKLFEQENRDINILFIEEPEAHTHPQMQYKFAKKIKEILNGIPNLQTFITSHSAHIVSQCDFEDLRYFMIGKGNIRIKNFHDDLATHYQHKPDHFKFLKQFLTLYASELFFADKAVFIEGVSERLLLPLFIKQYDESRKDEKSYIPLTSQSVSYIEAGANAKVFRHFIEFLGIPTLIITDIDGGKIKDRGEGAAYWGQCATVEAEYTSNVTIKHYLCAPETPPIQTWKDKPQDAEKFKIWFKDLLAEKLSSISPHVKLVYQKKEKGYHARSFEDAFISVNLQTIIDQQAELRGLKNKEELKADRKDFYELTSKILKLDGKSDFASSLLYLGLAKDIKWNTPQYIVDGLKWIAK